MSALFDESVIRVLMAVENANMSIADQFDLARDEILDRSQVRIVQGDRTKLFREEWDNLALLLVDRLSDSPLTQFIC